MPLSPSTSLRTIFRFRPTSYPSFTHLPSSTTFSPQFHTHSPLLFSFRITPHHNPSTKAYANGPRVLMHTLTTPPLGPPLSSYNFIRTITSHSNPSFTLATVAHLPITQFNLAYNFNQLYFTFCGQLLTALSAVLRLLNSLSSQNTLLIGPIPYQTTSWRSSPPNFYHALLKSFRKPSRELNKKISSSPNFSHTLTVYRSSPSRSHSHQRLRVYHTITGTSLKLSSHPQQGRISHLPPQHLLTSLQVLPHTPINFHSTISSFPPYSPNHPHKSL